MKKILLTLVMFGLMGFASASWECKDFTAGKMCVDLKYKGNGVYGIKKQFTPNQNKSAMELDCEVLTPDGYLKEVGTCDGSFKYSGKGNYKISYYVKLEGEKKIINSTYYFDPNASVDNSQDTVFVYNNSNASSSSSSASSTFTGGFSDNEKQILQNVHDMWDDLVVSLKDKYPNLADSKDWTNYANYVYYQMDYYLNSQKSDIQSYENFRTMIVNFVKKTKNLK